MEIFPLLEYQDTDPDKANYVTDLPRKRLPDDIRGKVLDYLNNIKFSLFWSHDNPFTDPFDGKCGIQEACSEMVWVTHGMIDCRFMFAIMM